MRLLPRVYNKHPAAYGRYTTEFWGEVVMNDKEQYFMSDETTKTWIKTDAPAELVKEPEENLGLRYNTGKLKFSLIPAHWTRSLAEILTKGANKYAPRNWETGLVHSEVLDSLHRHLDAFLGGERYDPETKCHHLGHVAWNALALMTFDISGRGKADLPKEEDFLPTMEK